MRNILIVAMAFISFSVFSNEVKIHVKLSPAGSFQAVSNKIAGRVAKKDGMIRANRVFVPIESFKTDIDLRDEHFKKHLKMADHPRAILSKLVGKDGKAKGTLEVAGVQKEIMISYKEEGNKIKAQFDVKASDFQLAKAQYMGVGVEDQVRVEVELTVGE